MSRGLRTLLRVRGLLEERRRTEATLAGVREQHTRMQRQSAEDRVRTWRPDNGPRTGGQLQASQVSGEALSDAARTARDLEAHASRRSRDAHGAWSVAARDEQTARRLADRARTEAAARAARHAERQMDSAALEQWRRRS